MDEQIGLFDVQRRVIALLQSTDTWKLPGMLTSLTFLLSELGEVADAITRLWPEYVRANEKEVILSHELADVLIMTCVLARSAEIDLDAALTEKLGILRERFNVKKE